MGGRARKIIEGLREATQGDFSCVTIDGVRWVRETQSPAVKRQVITDEMVDAVARIVDPLAFLDDEAPAVELPDDAPEVLLIGTGPRQVFLRPDVLRPLLALGIGIETMTTQAAARTYNILMSEERRVLALLLPGDPS